ncbi:Protein phosphatase 1 regulatory subunit 14A [Larimichthys crocea]|nr:Protein phosphatase 1 regulatory subunit 14A [Larimichthys crocea]
MRFNKTPIQRSGQQYDVKSHKSEQTVSVSNLSACQKSRQHVNAARAAWSPPCSVSVGLHALHRRQDRFMSSGLIRTHQDSSGLRVLMAAQRVGRRVNKVCGAQSPGSNLQRRQARITVKYNRKELQRRLDVEKWIDCGLDELYRGRDIFHSCNNNTEVFIRDLVLKLHGLQKQEDLHNDGINLPQLHIYSTRKTDLGHYCHLLAVMPPKLRHALS